MSKRDYCGKKVHIIGMARSGMAAAEVLNALGAFIVFHDQKHPDELQESLYRAGELNAEIRVGNQAYQGIEEADFVVTSPGVPDTCIGLKAARSEGVEVLPEIELAYRISLAPIIAITGTNGKTTTTALTSEMLRCSGMNVFIAGNIVAGNIRLPLVKAAYDASEKDVIVSEISSFQLEAISSFKPRIAALLNVSLDHMDRYPNIVPYAGAKARIFEFQSAEDTAVLNADDQAVAGLAPGIKSRLWMFSRASEVEMGTFMKGSEVWVRTPAGEELACDTDRIKLRGMHNVENVLAASALVLAYGADKSGIQAALDEFEPPEHRLEPVAEIGGVEFLNNSMCTNVAAAVRSLEAIGRPAIVIAGGKDKGSDYTPLGRAFRDYAKHVVLIGKDAGLIESAAVKEGFDRITHADSMEDAVIIAWEHSEKGDTILLSPGCASFDMFEDFEHRGRVFKEAVRALAKRIRAK